MGKVTSTQAGPAGVPGAWGRRCNGIRMYEGVADLYKGVVGEGGEKLTHAIKNNGWRMIREKHEYYEKQGGGWGQMRR